MSLSDVTRKVVYVRKLIEEIGFSHYVKEATPIFCDNQSAIVLSKENVTNQRSMLDLMYYVFRILFIL